MRRLILPLKNSTKWPSCSGSAFGGGDSVGDFELDGEADGWLSVDGLECEAGAGGWLSIDGFDDEAVEG